MAKPPKDSWDRKIRNILFFRRRQVNLKEKVHLGYIQNGVGIIPCKVDSFHDIIHEFSAKDFETLNPIFAEYIRDTIDFIPPEYPVVIKIIGGDFSDRQKEVIYNTIREDFLYELGAIQIENRKQWVVAILTGLGMLLLGFFLAKVSGLDAFPAEFVYIIFWFFADIFVSYIFFDGFENRRRRVLAGRLASIGISFAKNTREGETVTKKEAVEVYREMEEMEENENYS